VAASERRRYLVHDSHIPAEEYAEKLASSVFCLTPLVSSAPGWYVSLRARGECVRVLEGHGASPVSRVFHCVSTVSPTVSPTVSQLTRRFGGRAVSRRVSRLVEAIAYGCIPVIPVAVHPMHLPFDEFLNYKQFSIGVAYDDLPDLPSILGNLTLHRRPIIKQLQVSNPPPTAC
jgi:hypothetical protein